MYSLNRCEFIGNLGDNPSLSYTASAIAVAKFSIACGEKWKDKDGNAQEKTEWINVVAWQKLAEICGQYLKKGSKVYVSGKMQTRSWDDKNTNVKRYATEIVIDQMLMLNGVAATKSDTDSFVAESGVSEPDQSLPF